jgi:membrane protein DedA with SNARE-associated domain
MPDFLANGSYFVFFFFLAWTGAGLPIPEEVFIVCAGVLSAKGQLTWSIAFVTCLAGALVGDCIMYYIGYHFGRGVLHGHRWWSRLITPERELRIEEIFQKHGLKAFFLARFLIGVRSGIYITAGILQLSFRRFFFTDLICASIVVGTVFGLGYLFGTQVEDWIKLGEILLTIVVTLLVAAAGIYLWRRHLKKKSERSGEKSEGTGER